MPQLGKKQREMTEMENIRGKMATWGLQVQF